MSYDRPTHDHPPAPTLGRWITANAHTIVPRVAPALTTTTVLIACRWWNAQGAEHSTGAAALMGAIALGAGACGVASTTGHADNDGVIAGTCFGVSGAAAIAGVSAYADGLALPLLLWVLATACVYAVCARYWRADRRADRDHHRYVSEAREQREHVVTVEAIRARAQVDTAAANAYAARLIEAYRHRDALDRARHFEQRPALTETPYFELPAADDDMPPYDAA